VNAEPAIADDLIKLLEPHLTAVILFASAAGQESTIVDSENKSIEELPVASIKRDVYEDSVQGSRHGCK
jgi:hypothetical protein